MTRRRLFAAAVALHLLIVACGAARLTPAPPGTAAEYATRLYMALSGADGTYGFFAPVVDPQVRVRFVVAGADGRERVVSLRDGSTGEANLRRSGVARLLRTADPGRRDEVLRSLTASVLDRHADVARVTALVEVYGVRRPAGPIEFPSMAEYRDGVRPDWQLVDAASFVRPKAGGR